MVSKDQAIGWVIFIVCVVIAIGYVAALFFPKQVGNLIGLTIKDPYHAIIWLVAIPVLIAFIAILGIGAWIGWTMATTPPPKPIEEIEAEEALEEKEKEEKKK
ncbi:MAG: hypothetical protein AOA66_1197 [Candidatus Bathyarchaeota archaeon BA2]|nr:MAG: hypothetical protein AOA66_1197 [Candidatus Bathyarchaeota archaeon BA2]